MLRLLLAAAIGCLCWTPRGDASTGALFEVSQPMLFPGAGTIHILTTTQYADSYWTGIEISYTASENCVLAATGPQNLNLAHTLGITIHQTYPKRRPDNPRLLTSDTIRVTIDALAATEKVRAGVETELGKADAEFLRRACTATEYAVLENAARTRPRIRYIRLETLQEGRRTVRTLSVPTHPRRKIF